MRLFPIAAAAAALLGIASTPTPVGAKPDFSNMFPGDWHCSTKNSQRGVPLTWTQTTRISPDGYWLVTVSTMPNSQFHATEKMTYDPSTKRWVNVETDDRGGYGIATSPGWRGNTMVWSDALSHPVGTSAVTITRVSATEHTAFQTFVKPGGRVISVTDVCTAPPLRARRPKS